MVGIGKTFVDPRLKEVLVSIDSEMLILPQESGQLGD